MAIGAILAGISAVSSIAGGVMGSSEASRQNAAQKKAYEEQVKLEKKRAKKTNKYNKKVFKAEKKDYFAQRDFLWETEQRQFAYNKEIQDFRYLQDVRQYGKSVETYKQTLAFNSVAANQAYESVQAELAELGQSHAFAKQDMLVDTLTAQGQVGVGQAGRSQVKGQQATLATQGMQLAMMREEFRSADRQAGANMRDAAIQRYAADINAKANLMLRPDRAPEPLAPMQGPERTFIKPMKVEPGYISPPIQQSTSAPLIAGFSSAVGSLSGINWGGPKPRNPVGGGNG